MSTSILWFAASLLVAAQAAVDQDEVVDLPELTWKPPFKHYSGYLKASGVRRLHYWFIESAGNPKTDPVVLWLNGGPGCSSMDGLLSEHGPFLAANGGKSLNKNIWSWNTVANMLYLEAPAGVGYSYAKDKNYTTGDDQVSLDNFMALKDFFSKYPEFAQNDFYVTGESYGGIYVPTLSVRVAEDSSFNLKGFAVGNGLSDRTMNDNSAVYFWYYHGLFGIDLWTKLVANCCQGVKIDKCDFVHSKNVDCQNALNEATRKVGNLNIYNLYGECYTSAALEAARVNHTVINPVDFLFSDRRGNLRKLKDIDPASVTEVPPCVDVTSITAYLNRADVRKAIHIPDELPAWEICSGAVGALYKREYDTMRNQYLKLLKTNKYSILVYNGDVDMACNFFGDQWFVDSLEQKLVSDYEEWYYISRDTSQQVAGFVKRYKNLKFVTIKGAGHMVPQDKPIPALKMFADFIHNKI